MKSWLHGALWHADGDIDKFKVRMEELKLHLRGDHTLVILFARCCSLLELLLVCFDAI
jgi:hypothetical protein